MMSGHSHSDHHATTEFADRDLLSLSCGGGLLGGQAIVIHEQIQQKRWNWQTGNGDDGPKRSPYGRYRWPVAIATSKDSTMCLKRSMMKKRQYRLPLQCFCNWHTAALWWYIGCSKNSICPMLTNHLACKTLTWHSVFCSRNRKNKTSDTICRIRNFWLYVQPYIASDIAPLTSIVLLFYVSIWNIVRRRVFRYRIQLIIQPSRMYFSAACGPLQNELTSNKEIPGNNNN